MPLDLFLPKAKTRAEVCVGLEAAAALRPSAAVCQSSFFLGVDINLSVAPRNPVYSQSAVRSFTLCYLSFALTQWHKIAAFCASSGQVTQSHFNNSFNDTPQGRGSAGPSEQGVLPQPVLGAPAVVLPCSIQVSAMHPQHHRAVIGTQEPGPETQ